MTAIFNAAKQLSSNYNKGWKNGSVRKVFTMKTWKAKFVPQNIKKKKNKQKA